MPLNFHPAAALQYLAETLADFPEWTIAVAVQRTYGRWPSAVEALQAALAEQTDAAFGVGLTAFDEYDATTPADRRLVVSMAAQAARLEHGCSV